MEIDAAPFWTAGFTAPLIIAGPCSAETREQVLATAAQLADVEGVQLFRAGVWKPRTTPDSFPGVGEAALPWLREVRQQTGLRPCIEVAHARHVELAIEHGIDVLWIGARTTGSPFAVQEVADALLGTDITVLVKNPLSPDLALWMGALERVGRAGVTKIAAVHRGFSSRVSSHFRSSPMWRLPLELKRRWTSLPVLCDPSHIAGRRDLVAGVSQAAIDLGMDGLMVEVHVEPHRALSDAEQQLVPRDFARMLKGLVLRTRFSDDSDFETRLTALRGELDRVDTEILTALAKRWEIIARIARTKVDEGVIAFQLDRMNAVIERWRASGASLGLPNELVEEIYLSVHEAAVNEQTRLMGLAAEEPDDG